jgi:F0F1-type ATP synthase membrane subunit b/b'
MSINNLPEEEQTINPAENQEGSNLVDSIKDQAESLQAQAEEKLGEFKEQAEEKIEELKDVAGNLWNKVTNMFDGKEEEKKD